MSSIELAFLATTAIARFLLPWFYARSVRRAMSAEKSPAEASEDATVRPRAAPVHEIRKLAGESVSPDNQRIDGQTRALRRRRHLYRLSTVVVLAAGHSLVFMLLADAVEIPGGGSWVGLTTGYAINSLIIYSFLALSPLGSGPSEPGTWMVPALVFGLAAAGFAFIVLNPPQGVLFYAPVAFFLILLFGYGLTMLLQFVLRMAMLSSLHSAIVLTWVWSALAFFTDTQTWKLALVSFLTILLTVVLAASAIRLRRAVADPFDKRSEPLLPRLLYLRTFGRTSETQKFLRRFSFRWLEWAPLGLVAAPDVARLALSPYSVTRWLAGRLKSRYVPARDDFGPLFEVHRYLDGTFPVKEFHCLDDTWQRTLEKLMSAADTVIFDLRGFSADHRGCVFEIDLATRFLGPDDLFLLVDESSDIEALSSVLASTPPHRVDGETRRDTLYWMEDCGKAEVDALFALVFRQRRDQ